MRILILDSRTDRSGSAECTTTVADALAARGHEVLVVSEAEQTFTRATHLQLRGDGRSLWRRLSRGIRLLRLIRKHRIQVVQSCSRTSAWETSVAARLTNAAWLSATDVEERLLSNPTGARSGARVGHPEPLSAEETVDRLEGLYRSRFVKRSGLEIPVLCYHRLVESDAEAGKFDTHLRVDSFERQLRFLREHGYRTLHFSDLTKATVFDTSQRAVILTFDDGYEDNHRLLLPLLIKYDSKAVIYLVSGRQTNAWDEVKGERSLRLMTPAQRTEMLESGLVEFGAHTQTHPDLTTITPEQAREEIRQSRMELEAELGVSILTFAYPYGHLDRGVKESVREAGFRHALALHSGPIDMYEDPLHVRRIVVFPSTTLRRFRRKVSGAYTRHQSSKRTKSS